MKRLFLDANVVVDGIASRWSLSRAILMLCSRRICQAVLSDYVTNEIETALLKLATEGRMTRKERERMIEDYIFCVERMESEMIQVAANEPEMQKARFIRHLHDVPVLAAALKAKPDWLLSLNRKHFSDNVAQRAGLRISTPRGFLMKTIGTD